VSMGYGGELLFKRRWGLSVVIGPTNTNTPSGEATWMEVVFTWTSVSGATDYTLQIGTSSGASDYFNQSVGNVLTYTLNMPPGTYYARVVDNFTSTASAEQGPFYV